VIHVPFISPSKALCIAKHIAPAGLTFHNKWRQSKASIILS
jgi:hypothetical protein